MKSLFTFLLLLSSLSSVKGQDPPKTLTNQELQDFHDETLKRIKSFVDFLGVIADKNRSFEERNDAIQTVMLMFEKGATVEVSNINKGEVKTHKLRQYLENVKSLPYSRIEITNYDAARLDNWTRQSDGSYRATGTFFQEFKGWHKDQGDTRPYGDRTTKKIDADLRVREDTFYKEKHWMVLFRNVTVHSTERIPVK